MSEEETHLPESLEEMTLDPRIGSLSANGKSKRLTILGLHQVRIEEEETMTRPKDHKADDQWSKEATPDLDQQALRKPETTVLPQSTISNPLNPNSPPFIGNVIYVANLSKQFSKRDLDDLASSVGTIENVNLVTDPVSR